MSDSNLRQHRERQERAARGRRADAPPPVRLPAGAASRRGQEKELRQLKLQKSIPFHIFLQEISSEQTLRIKQNLDKRQRHILIKDFWFRMNWWWT